MTGLLKSPLAFFRHGSSRKMMPLPFFAHVLYSRKSEGEEIVKSYCIPSLFGPMKRKANPKKERRAHPASHFFLIMDSPREKLDNARREHLFFQSRNLFPIHLDILCK